MRNINTSHHNNILTILIFIHSILSLQGKETYYIFILIYGLFYIIYNYEKDIFRSIQNYYIIPAIIIFAFANYENLFYGEFLLIGSIDYRYCFAPLYVFISFGGIYRFSRRCTVSVRRVILAIGWGAVAGVLIRFAFAPESLDLNLLLGAHRASGLFGYNVNLADDIYALLIVIVLASAPIVGNGNGGNGERMRNGALTFLLLCIYVYSVMFFIQGQSRGGWISFIISLVIIIILIIISKKSISLSKIALFIGATILILKIDLILTRSSEENFLLNETYNISQIIIPISDNNINNNYYYSSMGNIETRILLWRDALNIIYHNPVHGITGWNTEKIYKYSLYPEITLEYGHYHNLLLDVSVRFGLIMFIIYIIMFVIIISILLISFLDKCERRDNNVHRIDIICLFFFIYLFTENLFDVNFPQKEIMSLIVFVSAIAGIGLSLNEPREHR